MHKKEVHKAIGNLEGSNIFNIFMVLGISTVTINTAVPDESFADIWVNIVVGILLMVFVLRGKEKTLESGKAGV